MPETVNEILLDVRQTIDEIGDEWAEFGKQLSTSYLLAYKRVQDLLNRVHADLTAKADAEQNRMTFALSLLTAGFAGVLARGKVLEFPEMKLDDLVATDRVMWEWFSEAAGELAQAGVGELNSLGIGALRGTTKPPAAAFELPAMGPAEYAGRLEKALLARKNALSKVARSMYDAREAWTLAGAQKWRNQLRQSPFMDVPKLPEESWLTNRAMLALLIGWGQQRDVGYWRLRSALPDRFSGELTSFEPLLGTLLLLGVPRRQITQSAQMLVGFVPRQVEVLNMTGFMEWTWSTSAISQVFIGLKSDSDGLNFARAALHHRN